MASEKGKLISTTCNKDDSWVFTCQTPLLPHS